MTVGTDRVSEGRRLVQAAGEEGLTAKLLGGVAIALTCPSAGAPPLARDYGDLDLITDRRSAHALGDFLEAQGYLPDREFNAAQGRTRMLFAEPDDDGHIDVFIDTFVMCHTLPLKDRLAGAGPALASADLLLTKLQIAEVNRKDVIDASALLLDHDLGEGSGAIELDYLTKLLSSDWGWWRTVTSNLDLFVEHLPGIGLDPAAEQTVRGRLARLGAEIEGRGKSMRWKARARIGDRVPWRDEPEEID